MDIYQMLDMADELLNIYGYEIYRNVGVVGGSITTAELLQEPIYVPKKESAGIIHRLDIFGEKKDIERPFGRIGVMYKRGPEKVTPADIYNLAQVNKEIDAYYGMYLTNTGYTQEALDAGRNNRIEIITEDRLEQLIGKATIEQPWWQGYPAFEPQIDYKQSLYYFKYYYEKILRLSWPVMFLFHHELTWVPYWKFTYYIDLKDRPRKHMQYYQGYAGLNAFTGQMDFVLFYDPAIVEKANGPEYLMKHEIVNRTFRDFKSKLGKVHKPGWIPKNVVFNVWKPALQKHEVKLAAQQYISKWFDVPPEEVAITGRELIYIPMWRIMLFNRPIIKNIHIDTEHFSMSVNAVDGESVNLWDLGPSVQPLAKGWGKGAEKGEHIEVGTNYFRPFFYRYFEWILYTLFGVVNYSNLMRRITWGAVRLYWSFEVRIQQWMMKLLWLGLEGLFWTLVRALSLDLFGTIFAFLMLNILVLPLHSIIYIWHDALRMYPHKVYPHPHLSKGDITKVKKKREKMSDAEKAYSQLGSLKNEGKLSKRQLGSFKKIRDKHVGELFKKLKE